MSGRTIRRIIVLEVSQDHNPGDPHPPWWEAFELLPPERWPELTGEHAAFARVLVERTTANGAQP